MVGFHQDPPFKFHFHGIFSKRNGGRPLHEENPWWDHGIKRSTNWMGSGSDPTDLSIAISSREYIMEYLLQAGNSGSFFLFCRVPRIGIGLAMFMCFFKWGIWWWSTSYNQLSLECTRDCSDRNLDLFRESIYLENLFKHPFCKIIVSQSVAHFVDTFMRSQED